MSSPRCASKSTMSVNVPPTSTPAMRSATAFKPRARRRAAARRGRLALEPENTRRPKPRPGRCRRRGALRCAPTRGAMGRPDAGIPPGRLRRRRASARQGPARFPRCGANREIPRRRVSRAAGLAVRYAAARASPLSLPDRRHDRSARRRTPNARPRARRSRSARRARPLRARARADRRIRRRPRCVRSRRRPRAAESR